MVLKREPKRRPRKPFFPKQKKTKPKKKRTGGGKSRVPPAVVSREIALNANAGAMELVFAQMAPHQARDMGLQPGMADGNLNNTAKMWDTLNFDASLAPDGASNSRARVILTPRPSVGIYEVATWTNAGLGVPATTSTRASQQYAAMAGAGVLYLRCCAMGVRMTGTSAALESQGTVTVTQQSITKATANASAILQSSVPSITTTISDLNTQITPFWLPTPSSNNFFSISATNGDVLNDVLILDISASGGITNSFHFECVWLWECIQFGSQLMPIHTTIGDPTAYAQAIGNELAACSHFAKQRVVRQVMAGRGDDGWADFWGGFTSTLGSFFFSDAVSKALSKLVGRLHTKTDTLITDAAGMAGDILDATEVNPLAMRLAGFIVSAGMEMSEEAFEAISECKGADQLMQWCETVLNPTGHFHAIKTQRGIPVFGPSRFEKQNQSDYISVTERLSATEPQQRAPSQTRSLR